MFIFKELFNSKTADLYAIQDFILHKTMFQFVNKVIQSNQLTKK